MSRIPDLEAWAIFARVAELRSFRAAAASLGLSNATVSKAVTRLENRLGVRLFHRTTRTLSLTPSGQALAPRASTILSEAEAAENAAREDAAGPRGLVRVAAPMSFGLSHVAPALPDLLAACPGLSIDLQLDDATVDLVNGGIDVALRIGALADSSLRARKLMDIRIILAAAPTYLSRHGTPQGPTDLVNHACFGYTNAPDPSRWRLVNGRGGDVTLRVAGPLNINNGDGFLPALRAGLGIALLPEFILTSDIENGRVVCILPEWSAPPVALHLVMPSAGPRPARVSAVVDFFLQRFAAGSQNSG